ncbi:PepSY-associated TM helix domain-containing protein [Thermomonas hydrothermalis]|uniref:PepSY-associated TM region n=1 Tax=Thermomonas hydrothermalis TaxID=213588 RepID=A0A1M4Z753_9GAMM|nr:PepSY-associated TM helix domain-containing protein [Thermomonas hydrothermalis]SHF13582.1 hypothetical protein SAMN02745204_01863 [Thermomonas hydrothermalis]
MHVRAVTRPSTLAYRWVRQLHVWIGAWGALAALLYGFTGLVMNHRFGDQAWPQGESRDFERRLLPVPAEARTSPEQLSLWLKTHLQLDAQLIRKGGAPGGAGEGRAPSRWMLSGGSAANAWSLEYTPGSTQAVLKRTRHSPLAALNRLHKAVGGGLLWTVLADSVAIGMIVLGVSGIWMWARGRTLRQMVFSVMGLASLVFLTALGLALS